MPTCVEGHETEAADYCDVCGSPITSRVTPQVSKPAAAQRTECPACGTPVSGRFCEACGHDSALPAPVAAPQPAEAGSTSTWRW